MPQKFAHRLHRNWPFMDSMAASAASKPSYDTKPKPRLPPVSGSRMILGVAMMSPNALKVSYSSCSRRARGLELSQPRDPRMHACMHACMQAMPVHLAGAWSGTSQPSAHACMQAGDARCI